MKNPDIHSPVITGCQILTALGDLDATWQGLMAGQSGLLPLQLPYVPNAYPAGAVKNLDTDYGSADRLAQLLEASLSSFSFLPENTRNCDIIVATTKGAADELINHPDEPSGQSWQIDQMVAEQTGLTGKHRTISAACASGTVAIIQGAKQVMHGSSKCVLVLGIDLLSSFVMAGFDALKGLSANPCKPFDAKRDGLSLGEGVGMIVICSEQFAGDHQLEAIAGIEGWGVSCDATHITAPSRDARGLIRVIEQATDNGTVPVGAINAHGTGTVYNDAMEMTAFASCWNEPPPFHSVKGALGHCLGAAGVIEAAIAIRSLAENCIPPSIGYDQGEAPAGSISGTSPLQLQAPAILSCNSGFGGINAGILFSRP